MSPAQGQWLETAALNAWSWDTTISTSPMLLLTLTRGGAAATPPVQRDLDTDSHRQREPKSLPPSQGRSFPQKCHPVIPL